MIKKIKKGGENISKLIYLFFLTFIIYFFITLYSIYTFFDIVFFFDIDLPKFDPEFSLVIDDKETLGECHGLTYPDRNEIHIREDVYERADNGSGRDRFTMAHELFHLLQHVKENISYARAAEGVDVPAYRSPEWQADAFGVELLASSYLIQNMNEQQVQEKCGVSASAARCQLRALQR